MSQITPPPPMFMFGQSQGLQRSFAFSVPCTDYYLRMPLWEIQLNTVLPVISQRTKGAVKKAAGRLHGSMPSTRSTKRPSTVDASEIAVPNKRMAHDSPREAHERREEVNYDLKRRRVEDVATTPKCSTGKRVQHRRIPFDAAVGPSMGRKVISDQGQYTPIPTNFNQSTKVRLDLRPFSKPAEPDCNWLALTRFLIHNVRPTEARTTEARGKWLLSYHQPLVVPRASTYVKPHFQPRKSSPLRTVLFSETEVLLDDDDFDMEEIFIPGAWPTN